MVDYYGIYLWPLSEAVNYEDYEIGARAKYRGTIKDPTKLLHLCVF